MSEQADATNAVLRAKGILPPEPETPDALTAEENERPELPMIQLPGRHRDLGTFYKEVGAVMCKNGVFLRDDIPLVLNKQRGGRLEQLTASSFRSYVDRHIWLFKIEMEGKKFVEVRHSMSKDIAGDALQSYDFRDLQRQIRRVNAVPLPVRRKDGKINMLVPGYDYDSEILTMPCKLKPYEVMPVADARTWLINFFKEFPFRDRDPVTGISRSLAVHVAAMLTPFCQGLLSPKALLPMFIYTANRPGSGKSLLCKSALYPVFNTSAALPFGRDEDELRKQLDTEALEAVAYIFFDNVKRKIQSPFLDAWLTQPEWKGRQMGKQREFKVEKQSVVFVSSNHAEVDKDANRRALFVELFLENADVNDRKFKQVIDDDYLEREDIRRGILSALWSLVVHWDNEGQPAGPRSLGSFEQWARVVGGIVNAAGFGDPLVPHVVEMGDTDTKDMRELVAELAKDIEEGQDSRAYDFDWLIEVCRDKDLFVTKIDGKANKDGKFELSRSSGIVLGKIFQKESMQVWTIPNASADGAKPARIRFGREGSKNWRRFHVDRLPDLPKEEK